MKKIVTVFLIGFVLLGLFASDRSQRVMDQTFDSVPMLDAFYKESKKVSNTWDDVRVSLITVSKDDPIYSWFGHAAILVEYDDSYSVMYDYGRFSFGPDFYMNFAMGRLWYTCSSVMAFSELSDAKMSQRTVKQTVLNFTPVQKKAIVDFLKVNASKDYRTYLYHHYYDNCATRLRDIINRATNGDFEKWAKAQPGYTFREETSRILHNNLLWQWLLDFLQSGNIDGENTRWEEMFLPSELEKAVIDYNNNLAGEQIYVTDYRDTDTRPLDYENPQSYLFTTAVIGIALALIALILKHYFPGLFKVYGFVLFLVLGLLGSLLFFMSFFTSHDVTWNNLNLLFINPLMLVCSFMFINYPKTKKKIRVFMIITVALILLNIAGKFVLPTIFIQQNWPQIITVLPLYLTLCF